MATIKDLAALIEAQNTVIAALTKRLDTMDVCLEGARGAFKELRAQIPAKRSEPTRAHRSEWQVALDQVRAAHGASDGAYMNYAEVRAQMAANQAERAEH